MKSAPNYLVQTDDLELHAYWDLCILLIDIHLRRDERVQLFKLNPGKRTTTGYCPVSESELRAEYENSKMRAI
jgi:hypothetical protein